MKNFIIKFSLCFVINAALVVLLFYLKPNDYSQKFDLDKDAKFDIISLGTSHGNSIRYHSISDLTTASFSKKANTLHYELQNYRYLKPHLKEGSIIIIPISFFSFGLDENRTDNGDFNPFVHDFYFYLPDDQINGYSLSNKIDVYANRARSNFFNSMNTILHKKKKAKPLGLVEKKKMLEKHGQKKSKQHMRVGVYSDAEKNIEYLDTLLKDAVGSGFKPVVITTPFYASYTKGFGLNWLNNNFYNYLDEVLQSNDVPYLDYSKDKRFTDRPKIYFNSDHFNSLGSNEFSEVLFKDLQKMGLLKDIPKTQ